MGADFPGDEAAIEMIKAMPVEARTWLHHHFGNSLQAVIGNIELKKYSKAKEAAKHAVDDLKKIRGGRQWRR